MGERSHAIVARITWKSSATYYLHANHVNRNKQYTGNPIMLLQDCSVDQPARNQRSPRVGMVMWWYETTKGKQKVFKIQPSNFIGDTQPETAFWLTKVRDKLTHTSNSLLDFVEEGRRRRKITLILMKRVFHVYILTYAQNPWIKEET